MAAAVMLAPSVRAENPPTPANPTSTPAPAALPAAVDSATTPAGPMVQAPREAAPSQSTAAAAADPSAAGPSKAFLKKAREAGFKTEVKKGVTLFCREDAEIGTRLKTKKCVGETQLEEILDQREAQRDQFRKPGQCGGSVCGGIH